MAEITVDVGVRLNVIQGELANLKKLLGGIEIGTAGFSKASKAIQQMERGLEKFKIQTDKSFGSTQQFNQAGKTLDKLEESLARTKIAFEGIKFSDLKLNPNQQKAFEQVEHQIEEAEARYIQFQENVKQGLIKGAGSKGLDLLGTDNLKKSFDDLDKIIDSTVTKNTKKLNEYKESLIQINALETKSKEVKAKQQAGLNENTYKDLGLEQYLAQYKGGLRYKPGVKNDNSDLLNTLADNLGLSKETRDKWLENLKNGSIKDIQKAISEIQDADLLKGLQKKNIDKISTDKIGIEASYNELIAKLSQLQQLQEQFKAAQGDNGSLSTGMEKYNETLKECEALLTHLRQEVLGAFQGKAFSTFAGMNSELKTFTDQLNKASISYLKLQSQQATFNSMKMAVTNFMGFNQVLNLTKRAVSEAMNHIKQLDATMNGISIVTDMSTADLWKQVDAYSALAQKFGTTIQGAYDISKIYYQQGLETTDVMTLTEETLKLSKVSGLDYAKSTDYMTTALRGFKMEMQEASIVVDVYSNLAANTAVSQEELAVAMSKTASSMESVGSTFQDTSAMIATMVAVTRESATNIGSAMKSIASRYGELTKDPQKLIDSEGEVMSFNKVDAALQSVGISMQTTNHQFRDFTDVIVELSEKWDTLDSTQQRYIATQFAGNRQQSRFLALVSNGDLLRENMETAANSEDVGTIQALKAMDSIESKMNQVQVAAQQFYTTLGAEGVWKGALDGIRNYIDGLNNLPKLFDKVPVGAIVMISNLVSVIKGILYKGIADVAKIWKDLTNPENAVSDQSDNAALQQTAVSQGQAYLNALEAFVAPAAALWKKIKNPQNEEEKINSPQPSEKTSVEQETQVKQGLADTLKEQVAAENDVAGATDGATDSSKKATDTAEEEKGAREGIVDAAREEVDAKKNITESTKEVNAAAQQARQNASKLGNISMALNMIAGLIDKSAAGGRVFAGVLMTVAGAMKAVQAYQLAIAGSSPWMAIATAVTMVASGISTIVETDAEELERLSKASEEANNRSKEANANYKILDRSINKLNELKEARYDSAEAAEEYQTAVDELAEKYPQLITNLDAEGNAVIEAASLEAELEAARRKSAIATMEAAEAEKANIKKDIEVAKGELADTKADINEYNSEHAKVMRTEFGDTEVKTAKELGLSQDVLNKILGYQIGANLETVTSDGLLSHSRLMEIQGIKQNEDLTYFIESEEELDEALKEKYGSDAEMVKSVIKQLVAVDSETDKSIQELYGQLTSGELTEEDYSQKIQELIALISSDAAASYTYGPLLELLENYQTGTSKIQEFNDKLEAANKKSVSGKLLSNAEDYKFYQKLGEAQGLLVDALSRTANDASYKDILDSFQSEYDQLNTIDQQLLLEMWGNRDQYSVEDFEQVFSGNDTILQSIRDYYADVLPDYQSLLIDKLNTQFNKKIVVTDDIYGKPIEEEIFSTDGLGYLKSSITNFKHGISADLQNWISNVLDLIHSYEGQGMTNAADDVASETADVLNELDKIDDINTRTSITSALKNNDITNISGIDLALKELEEVSGSEEVRKQLKELKNTLIYNLPLAIDAYTDKLISDIEDVEKNIKDISKGMSISEALTALDKINAARGENQPKVSLSDMKSKGGKIYFDDQKNNLRQEYVDVIIGDLYTERDAIQEQIDALGDDEDGKKSVEALNNLISDFSNDPLQLFNIKQYQDIAKILMDLGYASGVKDEETGEITKFQLEAEKFKELMVDDPIGIIIAALTNRMANANSTIEFTEKELQASEAINAGEYVNALALKGATGDYKNKNEVLNALATSKTGEELSINYDALKPVQDAMNSAYNSFFSDLFTKGAENLHFEDYQLDIDQGTWNQMLSMSYEEIVATYGNRASMLIEEQNALMVQAIEKDTQKTQGAEDALKNVNFLQENLAYASLDTIQQLADSLGVAVKDLFDPSSYDAALGGYKLNMAALTANGLNNITNKSNIVLDSINAFLDSISQGISNGLEGKLDYAGRDNLIASLKQYNIDLGEYDFTKTADGLKLSQQKAIELYNELKKIDAVAAKTTFDSLAKSLEDSSEHYTDISTIAVRISELQKLINDPKVSTARRQEYEAELAVAEEIYRVRSSTDNKSFDFMNRDLSNGMQNPIDYWNSTGEAYKAMNQAAKSGYMEIQDFYNIVNEMNNMAAVSGQTLSFMGQTLSGKAEDAAALIEAGMSALKNVDGEGVKIALSSLGVDFATGAADMSGDFDTGVKAMAKSQIKMLDAAINMLEAMVAMENIDANGDGAFDFGEIFADGLGIDKTFTQPVNDWIRQIDAAAGGIKIGGKTLLEALQGLDADQIVALLNQLKNIDWTLGDANVFSQIQGVLSTFFTGVEIKQRGPSIFEALDMPPDANSKLKSFNDWCKKAGLAAEDGKRLYNHLAEGYDINIKSSLFENLENLLGLTKDGQKETFESFIGKEGMASQEEIELWSQLDIKWTKKGNLQSASYTASDGTIHQLDKDNPDGWQDDINRIEEDINNRQTILNAGGKDTEGATNGEPIKLHTGVEIDTVIDGKGQYYFNFNGQSYGPYESPEKAEEAALAIEKESRTIGGELTIDGETGTLVTKDGWTVKHETELTDDEKTAAEQAKEILKGIHEGKPLSDEVQQEVNSWIKTNEDGKQVIEIPGFEPKVLEDGEDPHEAINQLITDMYGPDEFAEIPEKIAEGIQKAFEGEAGTKIGEAISKGIKEAFGQGGETGVGEQAIPIDNINVKPTKITVDATGSTIEGLDKIQELLDGSTNENGEVVPLTKNITVTLNNGEAVSLNVTGVNTETDIWTITGIDAAGNIITLEGTEIAGLTLSGSQWTLNTIFGNGLGIELGNAKITGLTPNGTGWTINAVTSNGTPISFETPTITGLTYSSGWKIDAVTSSGEQLDLGDANITGLTPSENGWTINTVTAGGEKITYTNVQISGLTPSGSQWTINSVFGNGAAIDLGKATVTGIQNNNDGTWTITTVNGSITLDLDSINGLNNGEGESGYSLGNIVSGILNLSAQTKAAEDEIEIFRQNQESTPLKLSYVFSPQNGNKGLNDTYLSTSRAKATTIARNWEGSNKKKGDKKSAIKDIKDNEDAIVDYVQQVQMAVQAGESLSDIDYNNILSLKEILSNNTSGGFLDQFSTTADKILSLSDANKSDSLTGLKELAQSFSGLEVGELPQVAIALGNIASAAERLKGIPWDTIADGIKKVAAANSGAGEPATNSGSGGNTGGVGGLQSVQLDVKAEKVDAAGASIAAQGGSVKIEGAPIISTNAAVNVTGSSVTITGVSQNNDEPQPKSKNNTGDSSTQPQAQPQNVGVNLDISEFTNGISTVQSAINGLDASNAETAASKFNTAMMNTMKSVPNSKTVDIKINTPEKINVTATVGVTVNVSGGTKTGDLVTGRGAPNTPAKVLEVSAKAKVKGNTALSKGRGTLMGELGRELVVSGGKYYTVGDNGAEFVDLPDDAIVFNHQQTKRLLGSKRATGGSRGKPVKSEAAALSFATGNVSGPALASASAALAALKQIRAMWQSMLDASAKDLGSQAGRGGGGGGGGGGGDDAEQPTTTTDDIQRWYNWLRQIDKIEQDISYQEKLQTKYENDRIANGQKIYKAQKQQYDLLGEEIKRNEKLAALQKSWYDNKRAELAASSYGKIFTYDENGLQQYTGNDRPGSGVGLDILENLTRRNVNGQAIDNAATAKKQLAYLQSVGFNLSDLLYNDDGTKVAKSIDKNLKLKKINKKDKDNDLYTQMMENFWNNVDSWRDELDSLYDSYHEQQEKIIENQNKQNEILQAFVENELDVEQQLLEAIESREQALIDKLQDQKEALEKSNDKFIKGLTDQLNKEKEMRQNNERDSDLVKLQRQLAILQRSGGSASQIKSLQDQIASQQQDMYYEERQQQIDAIQEASDKQLERLDTQISIMTETLDYQKENGLLWNEVRDIMETNTPEEAAQKILDWNNDYASKSALDVQESIREFQEAFQQWTERRDDENDPLQDTSISRSDAIEDIEAGNKEFSALSGESKSKIQSAARNAGQKAYDEAIANGGTEEEAEKAYRQAYSNTISDADTLQKYKNIESHGADAEEAYSDFVTDAKKQQSFINTSLYKQNESDIKEKFIEKFVNEAQYDDEGNIINRNEASRSAMAAALNDISADNQLTDEDKIVALTSSVQSYKTPSKTKKLQKSMVYAAGSEIKFKDGKPISYKYKNSKGKVVSANFLQTTDGNWVLASLFPEVVDAYNRNSMVTAAANYINDAALSNFSADAHENETVEVASLYSSIGGTQYGVVEENGKITNKAIGRGPISISGVKGYVPKETSINETKTPRFASIQVNAIDGKLINGGPISFTPQNLGWKKGIKASQLKKTNYWAVINALKNKNDLARILAYKQGGMADFTGPAWLDGTKTKPEAVLNAAQTDFLKHDLLGNKRNSLASIVTQLQDIFDNTIAGATSSTSSDESITIENVSINFNAGTISSDYDARRAGELVKEEMLKIARKTGNRSVSRR